MREGNNGKVYLSVVVPVYNEAGAVVDLHQEILSACQQMSRPLDPIPSSPSKSGGGVNPLPASQQTPSVSPPLDKGEKIQEGGANLFEIIFVNDGSTDQTLAQLKSLRPIKIVNFRKNFGQTAALDAGIKIARGELIATLDGDGQNDPADIPRLIEKLKAEDLDVVSGWRKNRQDNYSKKILSKIAACIRKKMINDGIHDSGCTLKVYRKECFNHIDLAGEMHRFIPALLRIKGFKIGEIAVNHRARQTGQTKYNWRRAVKGLLDIFAVWFWRKYANRPLHFFGTGGIVLIVISIISGAWAFYRKIILGFDLSETVLTELALFGFLIGVQFIIFGLLADIMSKIYFSNTKNKIYDIEEVINNLENEKENFNVEL